MLPRNAWPVEATSTRYAVWRRPRALGLAGASTQLSLGSAASMPAGLTRYSQRSRSGRTEEAPHSVTAAERIKRACFIAFTKYHTADRVEEIGINGGLPIDPSSQKNLRTPLQEIGIPPIVWFETKPPGTGKGPKSRGPHQPRPGGGPRIAKNCHETSHTRSVVGCPGRSPGTRIAHGDDRQSSLPRRSDRET